MFLATNSSIVGAFGLSCAKTAEPRMVAETISSSERVCMCEVGEAKLDDRAADICKPYARDKFAVQVAWDHVFLLLIVDLTATAASQEREFSVRNWDRNRFRR